MRNYCEAALRTVCTACELTPEQIRGRSRLRPIVEARRWYCLLTERCSLNESGRYIGLKHDVVLYHRRVIRDLMAVYPVYRDRYRVMHSLFRRILSEEYVQHPVSTVEWRVRWAECQRLLERAESALLALEGECENILESPCTVMKDPERGLIACPLGSGEEPLTLDDVLARIKKRNSAVGQQPLQCENNSNNNNQLKEKNYED